MRFQHLTTAVAAAVALVVSAGQARAQQFQQATAFPGTAFWSEGVEFADVDHDGDLDMFVADGDGFASAGTARQNKLFINQFVPTGVAYSFVDESVARLGTHTSTAKGVTTADVNGDGWVDVLFANAFNTQLPFLYINQGAANPGFFTFEGSARGLTTLISAGSACFGDLDDDGDLDLVINDNYNVSPATKKPHLYFNDGAGNFTENAAALGGTNRISQMDIQMADVDNDWDVDVIGINKASASPAQYLFLNNGSGTFTDSSTLLGSGSGAAYEAEVGDLDGDNDVDLFFVSLSGFAEGAVRNNVVGLGTTTFTNQSSFGADDDNEISLFDYDNDGDYDILVGSLAGTEKFYRNDGGFVFTSQNAIIQAVADSTLDCTVVDMNNDGKYDIATVQGESGGFTNRYYKNTGAADTVAPVITATNSPASAVSGSPVVVKAKIKDQVLDDGVNYVTASGDYVITSVAHTAAVSVNAGAFAPASLTVPAGTTVTWTNNSGSNQNVSSTTAPYTYASATLAPAATYSRTFVKPGVYTYSSTLGGFAGTITVTGTSSSAAALHMGGQMYRFRMNDTAGGTGVQLAYELRFVDWPGNTRVSDSVAIPLTGASGYAAYCLGDGSGNACPCGNNVTAGSLTGCASSLGVGGQLQGTGVASLTGDSLVAQGTAMPNGPCLYFQGNSALGGGLGLAFGDGLRCAGGGVIRLAVKVNSAGASQYPGGGDPSISVKGLVGAPGTRFLQIWYRDSAAFCQPETFNLTNGLSVVWTP